VLPISHDEVVHGKGSLLRKMPGDRWQQLAGVRAFLSWQWAHPGKQLLFMGQEFAQDHEWAEQRELDWGLLANHEHEGVRRLVADLNSVYVDTPALWSKDTVPEGFQWIEANDAPGNVVAFARWGSDPSTGSGEAAPLVCITNFSPVPHENYRVGLPFSGDWTEVINTDAETYGGSGVGNLGTVTAHEGYHQGQPANATLRVPPMATLWLRSNRH
jgi:1,4-alpha-glucan branching enzyme